MKKIDLKKLKFIFVQQIAADAIDVQSEPEIALFIIC